MSQDHETNQQVASEDAVAISPGPEIEELLRRLERMVVQLQRVIDGRSRESLQQPGRDGHWGAVEILCYLRDWELVIHERVRRMTDGDEPTFTEPDTTMWPLEHEYGAQDGHIVMDELAVLRGALVGQLREVDQPAWDRTGVFDAHGVLTLRDYLEEVAAHDQRYIDEAREALA